MDLLELKTYLLYSFLFNMVLLLWWAAWLKFAGDLVYRLHCHFTPINKEHFYSIHYAGMMLFKLFIIAVFLMPCLALTFIG
jgi:hypothetical protein